MKIPAHKNKNNGTPIVLPDTKKMWIACFVSGAVFWLIGLILWKQGQIDENVLFYFNDARTPPLSPCRNGSHHMAWLSPRVFLWFIS